MVPRNTNSSLPIRATMSDAAQAGFKSFRNRLKIATTNSMPEVIVDIVSRSEKLGEYIFSGTS